MEPVRWSLGEVRIMEYRNAISLNTDNTRIDCEINHPEFGWTPYTLDATDTDMHVDNNAIFSIMEERSYSDVEDYVAPPDPTQEEIDAGLSFGIRAERKQLLVNLVDPVVNNPLRWDAFSPSEQNEITQYRTDLLNVTEQDTFPASVIWPTAPSTLGD